RLAERGGFGEVVGQLVEVCVGPAGLECLADTAVEPESPRGRDLFVERRADERVHEGVAPAPGVGDEPYFLRFLERVEDSVGVDAERGGEDLAIELTSDDGRSCQCLVGRGAKAREPVADDLANALRDAELF